MGDFLLSGVMADTAAAVSFLYFTLQSDSGCLVVHPSTVVNSRLNSEDVKRGHTQ